MKTCTKCGRRRRKDAFRKYWGRSSDGLRPICRDCQRKYEKYWRDKNQAKRRAQKEKRREKDRLYRIKYILKNRAYYLVSRIKKRCLRKKVPFDLDKYLPQLNERIAAGKCEVTGYPLRMTHGKQSFDSVSLDRINPSAGYVYANIRVVCFVVNAALGNWGVDHLRQVMEFWLGRK